MSNQIIALKEALFIPDGDAENLKEYRFLFKTVNGYFASKHELLAIKYNPKDLRMLLMYLQKLAALGYHSRQDIFHSLLKAYNEKKVLDATESYQLFMEFVMLQEPAFIKFPKIEFTLYCKVADALSYARKDGVLIFETNQTINS